MSEREPRRYDGREAFGRYFEDFVSGGAPARVLRIVQTAVAGRGPAERPRRAVIPPYQRPR